MWTDEEAFQDQLNEHEDDHTCRLVFADWLQENGDEDRAEFIRVQCERARLKLEVINIIMQKSRKRPNPVVMRSAELGEREALLLHYHPEWYSVGPCKCGKDHNCALCHGTGLDQGALNNQKDKIFHRGFLYWVKVYALGWCLRSLTFEISPSSHIRKLVKAHPLLMGVEPQDRIPGRASAMWNWLPPAAGLPLNHRANWIYKEILACMPVTEFDTPQEATLALAQTIVRWTRDYKPTE